MVPVSEHLTTHKCDDRGSQITVFYNVIFCLVLFIRASFVGRVCGMVQGKTDVIAAEAKWKMEKKNTTVTTTAMRINNQ